MTTGWDPEFYKTSYEGVESLENFPTTEALQEYRNLLLRKTEEQVAFIARHLDQRKLRVIEFGSGNGRLSVALALQGMLDWGLGVEISQSRVTFAQQWAADLELDHIVRNVAGDALEFSEFESGVFDLAVCITGTFAYFRPIAENAPLELLRKMHRALAPGGHLLLELYQMPEERKQMFALNNGKLRTWQPLPPEDRFAYYLDDLEYWDDRRILRHGKIFIGRNGMIDAGRVHIVAYYTGAELTSLLRENGFNTIQTYESFKDTPYCEGRSSALIVLAARSH